MTESSPGDPQAIAWTQLHADITKFLSKFGSEDSLGNADYWVLDDNWGTNQQKLFLNKLSMLDPIVISGLQRRLSEFPGWEIVVVVSLRGSGEKWPDMGLTIRTHEIIDGLHRSYFPSELREIQYAGSRPGTDRD